MYNYFKYVNLKNIRIINIKKIELIFYNLINVLILIK